MTHEEFYGYAKEDEHLFNVSSLGKIIKESIEEAIENRGLDLISDMVEDNPDWWARQVSKVLDPALKKALMSTTKALLKACAEEAVKEYCEDNMLSNLIEESVKEHIKSIPIKEIRYGYDTEPIQKA